MPARWRWAFVLVLVVAAACEKAAPQQPPRPVPRDAAPVPAFAPLDVVIALDMSKSMEDDDIPRDRLDATQTALGKLVAARSRDRIGLVLFGQQAKVVDPLTRDRAAIARTIGKLRIGDVPELGTAIGDGLGVAVDELEHSEAKRKVVVLLADGDNNWVTRFDPDQAAAYAKQHGVVVHCVLVGSDKPDPFLGASVNPATLQRIADTTGGILGRATDPAAFDRALDAIGNKLDEQARR